jgi:hypothetical protein
MIAVSALAAALAVTLLIQRPVARQLSRRLREPDAVPAAARRSRRPVAFTAEGHTYTDFIYLATVAESAAPD